MQRYNGQLINQFASIINGNAAAGALVTVKLKSTGSTVTLYAEDNLSGATLANPLTADAKGYYGFYAPDGVYTLDVSISGTPQLEIQLQDVAALQAQFNDALANAGYIPVGTFAAGCTVSQSNGVVSDGSSFWRWDGALPKAVTAGSEPTPTGLNNWILVGGDGLRGDLAAADSAVLVSAIKASDLAINYNSLRSAAEFLVSAGSDSAAVAAAFAVSDNVLLPNIGRAWNLTGITIPADGSLIGQNTDVTTTANATCISHSQGSILAGVNVVGSGKASGLTSQVLVQVPAVGRTKTVNCKLSAAGGKAWWVTNYYLGYLGSDLVSCDIFDNKEGAVFGNRGEYCIMSSCTAWGNDEAVIIDGGNQRIIGNNLSSNVRGLWVKTGTNGDHSIVNDNIINHCTIGIQCDTLTAIDMSFNGNMLYYSPIILNGCEGVMFNGGTISSTSPITEVGAINCVFDGVYFPGGINNTPNSGSPSMVIYKNSKFDRAEAILQAQDLDNSFAKSRRVSDTAVAAGANSIAAYTQRTQNSISANSGFTYKLLFNTATGIFSALTNWVDRGFEIDVSATLTISRTAADVDISKVFVEIVDASSNDIVYGSFNPGRKITLAGDVRCHTYSFAGKIPRADFKVLVTNQSADSVTMKANATGSIRSEINVSGW